MECRYCKGRALHLEVFGTPRDVSLSRAQFLASPSAHRQSCASTDEASLAGSGGRDVVRFRGDSGRSADPILLRQHFVGVGLLRDWTLP